MTTEAISAAKATQTEMERKFTNACARLEEIGVEVADIALDAHLGDSKASAKLAKLRSEEIALSTDIKHLEAALASAKRRVAAAEAEATDDQERDKAREVLDRLPVFRGRWAEIAAGAEMMLGGLMGMETDFRFFAERGYAPVSWLQARVVTLLAAHTTMQGFDMHARPLRSFEKKDGAELVSGWASNIRSRAQARINRTKAAKRAA